MPVPPVGPNLRTLALRIVLSYHLRAWVWHWTRRHPFRRRRCQARPARMHRGVGWGVDNLLIKI